MFLYLEVLAMIGQYFNSGQLPVRFPLYIAMVAMARYIILDIKDLTELRMLAVSAAILLLTIAVLVIRYGHTRFPYRDGEESAVGRAPVERGSRGGRPQGQRAGAQPPPSGNASACSTSPVRVFCTKATTVVRRSASRPAAQLGAACPRPRRRRRPAPPAAPARRGRA